MWTTPLSNAMSWASQLIDVRPANANRAYCYRNHACGLDAASHNNVAPV